MNANEQHNQVKDAQLKALNAVREACAKMAATPGSEAGLLNIAQALEIAIKVENEVLDSADTRAAATAHTESGGSRHPTFGGR